MITNKEKAIKHFRDLFSEENQEVYTVMLKYDDNANNSFEELARLANEHGEPFVRDLYNIFADSPSLGRPDFLNGGGYSAMSSANGNGGSGNDALDYAKVGANILPEVISIFADDDSGGSGGDSGGDVGDDPVQDPTQPDRGGSTQKSGGGSTILYAGIGVFAMLVIGLIVVVAVK